MRNPAIVMQEMATLTNQMVQQRDQYYVTRYEQAQAEIAYDQAMTEQNVLLYHQCKESGDRLPAEDMRKALAHKAIDPAVYAAHLSKKAKAEAMDKAIKINQSILSALQSELSQMRVELSHA